MSRGKLPRVEVKEGEKISFVMTKDAPVYGLGEQVRGINKRGWIYISNCTDDPNHREDTRSLYAAHNFLLFAEKEPFGIFLDHPGKVTFDIGYTQQDTAVITMESWDMDVYFIDGKDPQRHRTSVPAYDRPQLYSSKVGVWIRTEPLGLQKRG